MELREAGASQGRVVCAGPWQGAGVSPEAGVRAGPRCSHSCSGEQQEMWQMEELGLSGEGRIGGGSPGRGRKARGGSSAAAPSPAPCCFACLAHLPYSQHAGH